MIRGMDAYRASGGSSTLATLAAEGANKLPRQSNLLTASRIEERLELAADVHHDRGSLALTLLALLGGWGAGMSLLMCKDSVDADKRSGMAVVFVVGVGLIAAWWVSSRNARARRVAAVQAMLAWPTTLPFPTEEWREYLVCDRPLVEIALRSAPGRRQLIDAVRAIDGAIEVEAIDDHTFRLGLPPRAKTFSGKHSSRSVRFGDRKL